MSQNNESQVSKRAKAMASHPDGGFPSQEQPPPGLGLKMDPVPDHGEDSYVGHGKLEGMRALITGGDSGIGRAIAIAFAREGADVAINHLPDEQPDADDTVDWIEKAGRKGVSLPGDIQDPEFCAQLVEDAVSQLGGLDILVNNAGFHFTRGEAGGLEGLKKDNVDRVLKTNIEAVLWITKAAVPHMGPGSSVINTSSIQSYEPSERLIEYAATKAAVNNLTVTLAESLGPKGIRVNAVAPGPIWTPLQPATRDGEEMQKFGADTPLGRAGQPAELAPAYVFLASPRDASYVSGTIIGVTGGSATV